MEKSLIYGRCNEMFWFPHPEDTNWKIGLSRRFSSDSLLTTTDIIIYKNSILDGDYGYIIPAELVKHIKLSDSKPSKEIKKLIFKLVPVYESPEDLIKYGTTNSPIQALEEKRGGCKERASVGAAIAQVNNVPYRIVASENLAPDIKSRKDLLASILPYAVGRFQRAITMPKYFLYLPEPMDDLPYQHKWLEVLEDGKWVTIDTVEWNPTTFFPFRPKAKERFVCKTGTLEELLKPTSK